MHNSPTPHHRIPHHILFLGAFALIAAAAAYALHKRPDVQRTATTERPPVAKITRAETSDWRMTQQRVLGIREVDANESRATSPAANTPAPAAAAGEYIVAEQPRARTVARVEVSRPRSNAQPRRHAHNDTWPSGSGGATSLASLPAPGD